MSKDRIKFTIPERRFWGQGTEERKKKLRELLYEIFQIANHEIPTHGDLTIICRPSQFGRFIARRNLLGLDNNIKELNAIIMHDPAAKNVIDVAERPNRETIRKVIHT